MGVGPCRYEVGIERDSVEVRVIVELGSAATHEDSDEALEVAARRAQQAAAEIRESVSRARTVPF